MIILTHMQDHNPWRKFCRLTRMTRQDSRRVCWRYPHWLSWANTALRRSLVDPGQGEFFWAMAMVMSGPTHCCLMWCLCGFWCFWCFWWVFCKKFSCFVVSFFVPFEDLGCSGFDWTFDLQFLTVFGGISNGAVATAPLHGPRGWMLRRELTRIVDNWLAHF